MFFNQLNHCGMYCDKLKFVENCSVLWVFKVCFKWFGFILHLKKKTENIGPVDTKQNPLTCF